jgi:hypothetical protein
MKTPTKLNTEAKKYFRQLLPQLGANPTHSQIECLCILASSLSTYWACQKNVDLNGITIETATTTKLNPACTERQVVSKTAQSYHRMLFDESLQISIHPTIIR